MKTLILTWLGLCLAICLPAQNFADNPPATKRSAAELAELFGPIALYPDALIALILPASTVPSDIVLGARFVSAGGNPATVGVKAWDSSVKALTRYPDTLKWLDENLEWTTQVGDAFAQQPVEVMESIQQLRAKARALGNLVDTPEQRVLQDDSDIRIIPAQPNYIYEPRYDSEAVYYDRPSSGPLLFFSQGYGVGSWLDYDFDWRHHRLYRGEWHEGWDYNRDRGRRDREDYLYINNNLTNGREWHPDPVRHRAPVQHNVIERSSNSVNPSARAQVRDPEAGSTRERHVGIAHPKPIVGAPHQGETVRRGEPGPGKAVYENKTGENSKAHMVTPKSVAPGITSDGKHGDDPRDRGEHKKQAAEPAAGIHHPEVPTKKEAEAKAHVEMPKHEEPKHKDSPKHEEPKHKDAPKHEEGKHSETPKHEESKHKDAPKHEEAAKHPGAAKHEDPKHEAAKPHPEAAKEKGKKGDKKKGEDNEKKKD